MTAAADRGDPISRSKRVLLFAKVPLALGVALSLAQTSPSLALRDAALSGAAPSGTPAPLLVSALIILTASVLPGAAILVRGLQRGLVFSIIGFVAYLAVCAWTAAQLDVVLPMLAPAAGWYVSQVMGIGWLPHSEQNVRDILPADQRKVFISYRRSLDEVTARMLKHELASRGFDVFLDVDNLGPSPRFDERLLEEISRRYNFVLLLSPGALDRCLDEQDWVRLEVAHALAAQRRVIPVTRSGFRLTPEIPLPAVMSSLPMHNAIEYSSTHHGAVIEQLVGFLCAPRRAAVT
jgi:hypothetical protein